MAHHIGVDRSVENNSSAVSVRTHRYSLGIHISTQKLIIVVNGVKGLELHRAIFLSIVEQHLPVGDKVWETVPIDIGKIG